MPKKKTVKKVKKNQKTVTVTFTLEEAQQVCMNLGAQTTANSRRLCKLCEFRYATFDSEALYAAFAKLDDLVYAYESN